MIKTETLLGKLFENTKSILLVTDERFNIRYASTSVETAFGLEPYSIVGRNAFEFVREGDRDVWFNCLQESSGNKASEITISTPDGSELHFDVTVTNHVANKEIRGLVIMLHDITDRKLKQRTLQKANDHLDHFIYKTIHDLRAPIHSAMGLIEVSARAEADEKEKYISLIKSNLQKIDAFIDEVSHYYRNEKLGIVKQKINFDELFRSEKDFLANLPGADQIEFTYESKGTADLVSDPLRLKSILTNILSNSIKYRDSSKEARYVKVNVEVDETECRIEIADNGLGIREQHVDKIFDIFFRSHQDLPGTGLGLYIVKDTVARLGGEINVDSRLGIGTRFVITIPNLSLGVNSDYRLNNSLAN